MALSTYAELQTSLSAWLDGSSFSGRETDFIALCEDELNARLAAAIEQGARIRPMMQIDTLTIDGEYVDLPDGNTVIPISLNVTGLVQPWQVRYISIESMDRLALGTDCEEASVYSEIGAYAPRFYTLLGDQIRFFPTPETTFAGNISRYVKVPALSDDVTTNWVLSSHRNAYLYGALAQAEMFGWKDDRMANLATLFANACDGIVARYPAPVDQTPLRSELSGMRPGYSYSSFMAGT